jgi:hypothetical protein
MPTVTLTSPVEGKQPGEKVTVDAKRAKWLIHEGYATDLRDDSDHTNDTTVSQGDLPTYAENLTDKQLEQVDRADAGAANAPEVNLGEPTTKASSEKVEEDSAKRSLVTPVPGSQPVEPSEGLAVPANTPAPERTEITADDLQPSAGTYNPDDHTVDEVNAHLSTLDPNGAEHQRILDAEKAGQGRKGIVGE